MGEVTVDEHFGNSNHDITKLRGNYGEEKDDSENSERQILTLLKRTW